MMEEQALCRIHRMGQQRDVTTIRYRMKNSFEEVCYTGFVSYRLLIESAQKIILIQDRKKDLSNLTFSNAGLSEADVGAGRLEVSR